MEKSGGEGIRTPGGLTPTAVFKTDEDARDHDGIRDEVSQRREAVEVAPTRRSLREPREGYVYFIFAPAANRVKIGKSFDPGARLRELEGGSAEPLEILHSYRCDDMGAEEARLHAEFHSLRVHREWFHADPELLDHIASTGSKRNREQLAARMERLRIQVAHQTVSHAHLADRYYDFPRPSARKNPSSQKAQALSVDDRRGLFELVISHGYTAEMRAHLGGTGVIGEALMGKKFFAPRLERFREAITGVVDVASRPPASEPPAFFPGDAMRWSAKRYAAETLARKRGAK